MGRRCVLVRRGAYLTTAQLGGYPQLGVRCDLHRSALHPHRKYAPLAPRLAECPAGVRSGWWHYDSGHLPGFTNIDFGAIACAA